VWWLGYCFTEGTCHLHLVSLLFAVVASVVLLEAPLTDSACYCGFVSSLGCLLLWWLVGVVLLDIRSEVQTE